MEGDANGAPRQPPAAYAQQFIGQYQHRDIRGGVASVTVDVENVVLPGILSRYSSLAARCADTPP
jgi:hypothetical protein